MLKLQFIKKNLWCINWSTTKIYSVITDSNTVGTNKNRNICSTVEDVKIKNINKDGSNTPKYTISDNQNNGIHFKLLFHCLYIYVVEYKK